MVEIVDFLINIKYIHLLIMMIHGIKNGLIMEKFLRITILFGLMCAIVLVILGILFIINIIYSIILKKKINCMNIIENCIIPSYGIALGIVFSTVILTFTIINEEIEIIEPNINKHFRVIVGEIEKFKNFPRRNYISLTKEYNLKKIGLDKYIDIDIKKTLHFDNYELNELIEKIDTMIEIDNNLELSLDEKKHLKDKVISSKGYKQINNIRNEIYKLIEEKDKNESIRKEKINLEEQKEILKTFKNL
ncbi:Uncharacterised protein [Fusobacterium necrogenes]|uniref:Uncharacterized protein n=1 Tax=Fusobacterium necrogenes TaxID=858 RepID=A0A377GP36_9FUSO|nr:hypothetical protein [Fusobacterium necrogenes]STO28739.1 Uncharacterised protein [Fusobacterium necrogenes]